MLISVSLLLSSSNQNGKIAVTCDITKLTDEDPFKPVDLKADLDEAFAQVVEDGSIADSVESYQIGSPVKHGILISTNSSMELELRT